MIRDASKDDEDMSAIKADMERGMVERAEAAERHPATHDEIPPKPSEDMTEAQKAAYWFDLYLDETTWRRRLERELSEFKLNSERAIAALVSARSETAPLVAGDLAEQRKIHDTYAPVSSTPPIAVSATPRTDAVDERARHPYFVFDEQSFDDAIDLARQLERELGIATYTVAFMEASALSATLPNEQQAVWDMLLLDGNCSDHTLTGSAKLRRILDDLIEARRSKPYNALAPTVIRRGAEQGQPAIGAPIHAILNELQEYPAGSYMRCGFCGTKHANDHSEKCLVNRLAAVLKNAPTDDTAAKP